MAYTVHKEHRQKTLNEIPTIWSSQITAYIYWWSSAGKAKATRIKDWWDWLYHKSSRQKSFLPVFFGVSLSSLRENQKRSYKRYLQIICTYDRIIW